MHRFPDSMTPMLRTSLILTATLSLVACSDNDDSSSSGNPIAQPSAYNALNGIDTTGAPDGIVDIPANIPVVVRNVFARYSQVTVAGAGRIHFLAQTGVSDEAHFRARRILEQHLTNVVGSALGTDKTAVREALVASKGTFTLFRDAASADPTNAAVAAFGAAFPDYGRLLATDAVVEGTPEYTAASPAIDGTFAATARFVVDEGGAAMAAFRSELATRAADAVSASLYTPSPSAADVPGDFLGRTLEAWYGIWGHDPRGDGRAGVDDAYAFNTRLAIEGGDPSTANLLASFFTPIHTYPAFLTAGYMGKFETSFDPATPYSHRSRYLTKVGLRGPDSARISGNLLDGTYQGALGDDEFEGKGGNDIIEGGSTTDFDRAYYSGASTEYLISPSPFGGGATQVQDLVSNRDGVDQVRFIEELVFTDTTIQL